MLGGLSSYTGWVIILNAADNLSLGSVVECQGQFRNQQQLPEWENLPSIVSKALVSSIF